MLVLSAFGPELQRFRELRPEARTLELGIGALRAAAATARALHQPPSAVVLLGTCGAYPGAHVDVTSLAIGDLVIVRTSRLLDPSVVSGTSVALNDEPIEADAALASRFASIGRAVTCATTLSLTTNDDLARVLARTGADVEHLETHGVALACAAENVPFIALLAVANAVGARGREEWRAHHRRVEDALGEALAASLG